MSLYIYMVTLRRVLTLEVHHVGGGNREGQAEEARRVFELIEKRLPHSEARAVILRYREHYSVREAAEKMGVDSMTLKGYVCEGLHRNRRLLRNVGADVAK